MEGECRMLKQNKLLVGIFLGLLVISLVSAVSISSPSQTNINDNFNLQITGSGFYALQMTIPSSLQIISDPSSGTRTGNTYKTINTGNLVLQLRGTQVGTYTISGQYTDGSGIKDLNSISIQVIQPSNPVTPACPTCPSNTAWSNCENNQQIKTIYSCSSSTNYICVSSTQTQSCTIPNNPSTNQPVTCTVGLVCKDSNNLAYQSSDCSLSSIQNCPNGCSNNACNPSPNVNTTNLPNLTVSINPPTTQTSEDFITQIINFIKEFINAILGIFGLKI